MKTNVDRLIAAMLVFSSPFLAWGQGLEKKGNQKIREIHDSDGDGWCDLWCSIFEIKHRSLKTDSDGDGITDYKEMLAMSDPFQKPGPPLDPEEAREAARIHQFKRKAAWEARRRQALEAGMELVVKPGSERKTKQMTKRAEKMAALKDKAQRGKAASIAKAAQAEKLAEKHGYSLKSNDLGIRFSGMVDGWPTFVSGDNQMGAASVSADELWPASAAPWASGSAGLDLTGSGQKLGQWEANGTGGVLVSHQDLTGRITQRDGAGVDTTGHATLVAGTMVGNGSGNAAARGVAYESTVEAYDLTRLGAERIEAAAGTYDPTVQDEQVIIIGNNSWSLTNGWERQRVFPLNPNSEAWFWFGGQNPALQEEPKFGRYTPADIVFEDGCVDLDNFVHNDAPHHLPIYSCGNDRGEGPGVNPQQLYYIRNANGTASSFNPNFFPRDWSDGDDGGYDTIATPGTAKNVLTVGACLDVVTPSGEPGFAPGSVVTPAEFSGAGPLDDGRIKPDLVAVGDVSASARSTVGVPVTDGLVTTDSLANNSYNDELARGTSFSAPAVAGGCALMLERRAELYPGLAPEDMWLSSTIKALAINGCDDVGLEGPDYRMGHGLFNAATSVAQIDEDHAGGRGSQIKEFDLDPNQSVSWLVNVEAGEPLELPRKSGEMMRSEERVF